MDYGLFLHYGLYSLLEGFYQGRETPFYGEWIQHSLGIDSEAYAKLGEDFQPEQFDGDKLVEFAISHGFTYLVLTAKHHDGFCLFHSEVSDFTSVKACGRDLVAELSEACRKRNFPLGLYYSQAQDWHHGGYRAYEKRPDRFSRYFNEVCLKQVEELLTHYGDLFLLWFDTPMDMLEEEVRALRDLVKKHQAQCQISGRIGKHLGDYLVTGDNMLPRQAYPRLWEVPMTLSTSWGYRRGDQWKTPDELLKTIAKVYCRGGRVLLNVGPRGDFSFPHEALERLAFLKSPLKSLTRLLSLQQMDYPFEDQGLLFFREDKRLWIMILDGRRRLGLYHLLAPVKGIYLDGEELDFQQTLSLEGDPYLGIHLPSPGPCVLEILCSERVSFLNFGQEMYVCK